MLRPKGTSSTDPVLLRQDADGYTRHVTLHPPTASGTSKMQDSNQVGCVGQPPVVRVRTIEQTKYESLWERAEYRVVAPGENVAALFLARARPAPGSVVIDFGAGTGRGAVALARMGNLRVEMLDFASNCLDAEVQLA